MATTNPFATIRARAGDTQRSLNWYQTQIRALATVRPNKLMSNAPDIVTQIQPGGMYMFFYDAKYKDTLPYWDQFPLVLPFRKVPGGFYGLNLHYLPYGARFKILGTLQEFADDEKMSEDTRLQINWRLLNSSSRLDAIKPCVKHYLHDHLQSRFLKIKYPDWLTAALLPVEKFVGADKSTVWRDSRKMY